MFMSQVKFLLENRGVNKYFQEIAVMFKKQETTTEEKIKHDTPVSKIL